MGRPVPEVRVAHPEAQLKASECCQVSADLSMAVATTGKPILLSTAKWHGPWFSECCGLDMGDWDVLVIDDEDPDFAGEVVRQVVVKFQQQGGPLPVMSMSDSGMIVHALAREELKHDERLRHLTGASLQAVVLCDHKLLTRSLVDGMRTIPCAPLTSDEDVIPVVPNVPADRDLILKPVSGVGSANVHKVRAGQPSPYKGLPVESGILQKAIAPFVKHFGAEVPNAETATGLLEEYVPPSVRKVSVDGIVIGGEVIPWLISDNVYFEDRPEVFDSLESPSSRTTPAEQKQIWETFRKVVRSLYDLTRGELDRQFLCIEMFVFGPDRVEVMEANIRVSANQAPLFHRVLVDGCPFRTMKELQKEGPPPRLTQPRETGIFGAALYRPSLKSAGPFQKQRHPEVSYYARTEKDAHVYGYGSSPEEARAAAVEFYDKLAAEELEALNATCSRRLGAAAVEAAKELDH